MKQKTMIEAFQSINKRRQSEEMPITALAMFAEAWDYRQAEIDVAIKQRDSFIKAHHIAMNDVCDQKAEIDALKTLGEMADKRIEYLVIRNTLLQARLEVAESNLNNSLGFIREEQSANDALQKRIDGTLHYLSCASNPLDIEVQDIEMILKGDKND